MLGLPCLPAVAGKRQYLILCSCTIRRESSWAGNVCPTAACLCNCIPSYFHLLAYQEVLLCGVPTLDHGLATFCFTGSIGAAVLNTVSEPLTTKPVLHLRLLSLSDFDALSHATLWGEVVYSWFMQTCVTCVWPEHHSNVSALTVALSTSQMSHVFKACYLQAVTFHCLSKNCLLTLMMTACKTFLLDFQINQLSSNACHVFHVLLSTFGTCYARSSCLVYRNIEEKKKVTNFFLLSTQFVENEARKLTNQTVAS